MNPKHISIKKGAEVEVEIESLAFGGMGISRLNDKITFVKNAIPGQKVRARITKKKASYLEARKLAVINESPNSVAVRCEHFNDCGGCTFQNLNYSYQLSAKESQIKELFSRIGKFKNINIDPIQKCDNEFNYRNKMEFTFSPHRWVLDSEPEGVDRSFALGLHMTGRYDKILDIHSCHIQPKIGDRILSIARDVCLKNPQLRPYDPKTHIGFLRFLMIRYGFNTPDLMVNIVTSYNDMNKLSPLTDRLLEEVPEITSMVNNVNTRKADVAFGEYETLLYGNPYIHEKLGDLTYEISANSFFQTNTLQGEVLYKEVEKLIDFKGDEIVYDLYCGTGTIGLFLAQNAKEVYGFEVIRSALEDAEKNADFNNIENVQFLKANLDTYFKSGQLPKKIPRPDVVIVDPPRAGMHPDMTQYLPKLKAKKIVYVSCNPTTQARDAKILHEKGYKINKAVMVDMFPHTPHIENIVLFSK